MLALLQRVTHASCVIDDQTTASIETGLMVLVGFESTDTNSVVEKMIDKVSRYRLFSDANDKMNLSVKDINGAILFVPQFTLVAETNRGLRPSFSKGAPPTQGKQLFDVLKHLANNMTINTCFGTFGADMQINLCNNGPVTFLLQSSSHP